MFTRSSGKDRHFLHAVAELPGVSSENSVIFLVFSKDDRLSGLRKKFILFILHSIMFFVTIRQAEEL